MDAPARSDASRRKLRTAAPSSRSTLGSAATTTTASKEHRGGAWVRRNCAYAAMASRGHGNSASVSTTGRGRRIQRLARNASKALRQGPAVSSSDSSADASEAWPVFASETWPPESRGSSMIARAALWVLVLLVCVLCCVSSRFRASVCVFLYQCDVRSAAQAVCIAIGSVCRPTLRVIHIGLAARKTLATRNRDASQAPDTLPLMHPTPTGHV